MKRTTSLRVTDTKRLAELVGDLGQLASYKDIDVAAYLMESVAAVLGIAPESIPNYSEIRTL